MPFGTKTVFRDAHRSLFVLNSVDMDFDPLSLYTPQTPGEEEFDQEQYTEQSPKVIPQETLNSDVNLADYEEDDDPMHPVHPLDLPAIRLQPPREVLHTLLRLLALEEIYNFSNSSNTDQKYTSVQETFQLKNIKLIDAERALPWFSQHCPKFNTLEKLLYLPYLAGPLKATGQYNAWLSKIISSGLSWIPNSDDIMKEATLRLSENCGRTAQPGIVRKIGIRNPDKFYKNGAYLQLREPSLTGDNLGLKTWGLSLVLSNRLVNNPREKYLREPVLELGSGTGLVGMASAILGCETFLTDLAEIVPNLVSNIELNQVECTVHELDWRDPSSFKRTFPNQKFKTIILSDPIYSSLHPQWVLNMVNGFFKIKKVSRVLSQIQFRPKYEEERERLWSLMSDFVEKESCIEEGFDDFGAMRYSFKLYTKI